MTKEASFDFRIIRRPVHELYNEQTYAMVDTLVNARQIARDDSFRCGPSWETLVIHSCGAMESWREGKPEGIGIGVDCNWIR